jgi:hypothetical protein
VGYTSTLLAINLNKYMTDDNQTTPVTTDTPVEGAEAVTTPEVSEEMPTTPEAPAEGENTPAA